MFPGGGCGGASWAGGAFTPASLPGLIDWWKADAQVFSDAGTTPCTNGTTVQQWNDQSGSGNNLNSGGIGVAPDLQYGTAQWFAWHCL